MKLYFLFACLGITASGISQFSPDGGQPGSIALHVDSVQWAGWAATATFEMGYYDVANTSLGKVDAPTENFTSGREDGAVVSLGDGGSAVLEFEQAIIDGAGPDFAVFENGFAVSDTAGFFELAKVAVSSDGEHFVEFPCTSLTEATVPAFGTLDSRKLDGLAGRFSAPYGVPFDLSDLPADSLLDLSNIKFVRITDAIGTSNSAFAKTDQDGMPILDPYPTAFAGGGFDLDAVGVIHANVTAIPSFQFDKPTETRNATVLSRQEASHLFGEAESTWYSLTGSLVSKKSIPLQADLIYVVEIRSISSILRELIYLTK